MERTISTPLMHAVLDGDASAEERAALDRLLAVDADARAELRRAAAAVRRARCAAAGRPAGRLRRRGRGRAEPRPGGSGRVAPTFSEVRCNCANGFRHQGRGPVETSHQRSDPVRVHLGESAHGQQPRAWTVDRRWRRCGDHGDVRRQASSNSPRQGDKATGTIAPAERYREQPAQRSQAERRHDGHGLDEPDPDAAGRNAGAQRRLANQGARNQGRRPRLAQPGGRRPATRRPASEARRPVCATPRRV